MTSSQRWKNQERIVATLLNGKRIPNNGFGQPDVIAGPLDVQVKTRLGLPKWFLDAVDQSIRDADEGQQPIVVVCHVRNGRPTRRFLIADLDSVLDPKGEGDDT